MSNKSKFLWMKCDLHMHSFNSKWKDHDRVKEMTASEYVDILIKNGVNVFSVTDHDCFSAKFYNSIKAYIKDKPISVIFGFEADIYVNESDFFQAGIYFSPKTDPYKLERIIHNLYFDSSNVQKKPKFHQIISALKDLENKFIIIPEGNKARGIMKIVSKLNLSDQEEITKYAMYKIFSAYDVKKNFDEKSQDIWATDFYSKSQSFSMLLEEKTDTELNEIVKKINLYIKDKSIKLNECEENVWRLIKNYSKYFTYFSFSDWHNSEQYNPAINNFIYGTLDYPFESLELAVIDPFSRIIRTKENRIEIPKSILSEVSFKIKNKEEKVEFSPGLNVIIGKRGSGKSLLLSIIEKLADVSDKNISKYKAFNIENIKGENYGGVSLSVGSLASVTILNQEQIQSIYDDPQRASKEIKKYFKDETSGDFKEFDEIEEALENLRQYDKNYPSLTNAFLYNTVTKNFSFNQVNSINTNEIINGINQVIQGNKNIVTKINTIGLSSSELDQKVRELNALLLKYTLLIKSYNDIIEIINSKILEIENGNKEIDKNIRDSRKTIASFIEICKNNFVIRFNLLKLLYLLNKSSFKEQRLSTNIKGNYLFVVSYNYPEDLKDNIEEKITESISKGRKSLTTEEILDNYLNGNLNLKQKMALSDPYKDFLSKEITDKKMSLYEIKNKDFDINEIHFPTDINKAVDAGLISNISNSSLGVKSVAYLDLLFDLNTNILVIDQPEDNIDNDYISNYLVPIIKKQKRDKQLIFVTHNPSVAVYGDAFNYIFASNNGTEVIYNNFMIERVEDRNNILKILDGGRESFFNRNQKYGDILGGELYEVNKDKN